MDLERLGKLLDQWKGLIAGITLLSAAGIGLWQEFLKLDPWRWSWRELCFVLLATVLVAGVAFRSRRVNASRLVDPDALKLDPQSPEQLVGRREDLDKLLSTLTNRLVFLVSESGAGKSALLRAGVAQGTTFKERFLPVYVDMSVLDWEDGPLAALREGFSRALPIDDPARALLDGQSGPKSYSGAFADYYKRTQRRPLLLLDQFDDYQAEPQHRDRFLPSGTRVWRTAKMIARENAFWRVLRQCLQSNVLSIIVASREDAAKGLESLRFIPNVPQFDLPRLEPGHVRMIIDRLTERSADRPAAIANPHGGWTALRDRLVDDLEARGHVLPQQLKVVLGGLRTLRRLTPSAYARAGRLAGLEATFVAAALARSARAATLSEDDVLKLVSALVDSTRQPPDKAPPRTANELAAIVGAGEDLAKRALDRLEGDEVVRQRGDEGLTTGWQLDHAYLAQPILRIQRERDQWRRLLAESAQAYAEATWRGKWSALLPVRIQFQLLIARLKGRFRYGEHRAYAAGSVARGLPSIAALSLAGGVAWAANEYDAAVHIETRLAQATSPTDRLTDDAAAALGDLTTRGAMTRWRVTRDIFSSPTAAGWFAARPELILRALVQLDTSRLDTLIEARVTAGALRQQDVRLRSAIRALIRATSTAALTDGVRVKLAGVIVESLSGDLTSLDFEAVQNMNSLAAELPDEDSRLAQWLVNLREAMRTTSGVAKGYVDVVAKLKDGDPRAAGELAALRDAIWNATDVRATFPLGQAYVAVAAKLKDGDARAGGELSALREAMGKSTNSSQLATLARAAAAVAAKLNVADPRAADVLAVLRDAIGKTTGLDESDALAQAYVAVAAGLRAEDPRTAGELAEMRAAMNKFTHPHQLAALVPAYAAAAPKLKDADLRTVDGLAVLRDAMSKRTNSEELYALARAYAAVAARLENADARVAGDLVALRNVMSKATSVDFEPLAQAYVTVVTKLKDADPYVAGELAALRDTMRTAVFRGHEALAQAYSAVAAKLKNADPRVANELVALREAISTAAAFGAPEAFAQAYRAVAAKLKDADPRAADELVALREAMSRASYGQPEAFAGAYAAMAAKLKDADPRAADELVALRDAMSGFTSFRHPEAVALAYAAVAAKLKDGDPRVADELAALRDAMSRGTSLDFFGKYGAFAQAYAAIATKLKHADPRATVELGALREAISTAVNPSKAAALAQAYAAIAKRVRLPAVPLEDIAVLVSCMSALRTSEQSASVAAAIKEAVQLGSPPLSWDKVGLVFAAALLHPVSAGKPSQQLVADYEEIIRKRSDAPKLAKSWSGDVWAFAAWAKDNLPGFDRHEPRLSFLPSPTHTTRR
jgi:hypothetical protein